MVTRCDQIKAKHDEKWPALARLHHQPSLILGVCYHHQFRPASEMVVARYAIVKISRGASAWS